MSAKKFWFWAIPFLALLIPWLGMLKTEEVDHCEHCLATRFRGRSFWFGAHIATQEYPWCKTFRSQVCLVLDRPCAHARQQAFLRKRMWGGVYCACPCVNRTVNFDFTDWLTPERRVAIERVAERDPQFAEEFVRRCMLMKDQAFFKETAARIDAEIEQSMQ